MLALAPSEFITNPDGSIYHLHLKPSDIADTIITVGDPERVSAVSRHFDHIEKKIQKREFVTHTGTYKSKRISVISTGIGTDNIDIVLNELDALANIDFRSRTIKPQLTSLNIIRIGTSGCLQEDIPVDTFLASSYGLGLDGLGGYYEDKNNQAEQNILDYLTENVTLTARPYCSGASSFLLEHLAQGMEQGITTTCAGFYAPQGRVLRLASKFEGILPRLANMEVEGKRFTNFEMETAGIYHLAKLLGHRAISFNALLANRITNEFSSRPKETVAKLIEIVLERIVSLPTA